jgi:hypothetical protein
VVAHVVQTASATFWTGAEAALTQVNGRLAAVVSRDGIPFCVINMVASGDHIDRLMWMMNTDKLRLTPWPRATPGP